MENIKFIGTIDFKDIKVNVYNDIQSDKDNVYCALRKRNPDSCYTGILYKDNMGQVSYPNNAVIPEQTEKDKEILPIFIITGYDIIDDYFISHIVPKLEDSYKKRNP